MAGAMWAARDVRLALNAQLVFVRSQRSDGRLPHAVWPCGGNLRPGGGVPAERNCTAAGSGLYAGWCLTLQGAFFASPAVDVAWFVGMANRTNAQAYLGELAVSLERYDKYLWSTRNDSQCEGLRTWEPTARGANCPSSPSPGAANRRGLLWAVGTRGGSTGDSGEDHSTKADGSTRTARGMTARAACSRWIWPATATTCADPSPASPRSGATRPPSPAGKLRPRTSPPKRRRACGRKGEGQWSTGKSRAIIAAGIWVAFFQE